MLGLDYGSDSEDESFSPSTSPSAPATTKSAAKPSANGSNSGLLGKLKLPPPSNSTPSSSSKGPSLPPPKGKKSGGPKKIVVELPKLDKHARDDELSDEMPATKKPRLGSGKGGASSLLSMLPAPKKAAPEQSAPQRVLGGGRPGVVYSAASQKLKATPAEPGSVADADDNPESAEEPPTEEESVASTSMLPPSMLLKGKLKTQTYPPSKPPAGATSLNGPAVDFFSLGAYAWSVGD